MSGYLLPSIGPKQSAPAPSTGMPVIPPGFVIENYAPDVPGARSLALFQELVGANRRRAPLDPHHPPRDVTGAPIVSFPSRLG